MRIAIVNDLMMAVEALRRVVVSHPGHTVAWIAKDGVEAVQKCADDRPDLVLMDLIMPVMNGVEATRRIMHATPCAILVVTATVEGNMSLVFEAMSAGALDAVNTPTLGPKGEVGGGQLLLTKIATIGALIGHIEGRPSPTPAAAPRAAKPGPGIPLVVIGASTGGPAAVAAILSRLRPTFPAALVIVQHVDELFAKDLADWLGHRSPVRVQIITPGARPQAGVAGVACTNEHLVLRPDLSLGHEAAGPDNYYRPSVDVFFGSVARHWPAPGVAILLTGMGRDGAEGLLALRKAGWVTLAQDEASCIVYGMPKAAATLGAAAHILPPAEIGRFLDRTIR